MLNYKLHGGEHFEERSLWDDLDCDECLQGDDFGGVSPIDPRPVVGEDYEFTCFINLQHEFFTGKDRLVLYFQMLGRRYSITRMSSVIRGSYIWRTNFPSYFEGYRNVYCIAENGDQIAVVGRVSFFIRDYSEPPHSISIEWVYAMNLSNFEFAWIKERNQYSPASVYAFYKYSNEDRYNLCKAYTESPYLPGNVNQCSVPINSVKEDERMKIKVYAANAKGSVIEETDYFRLLSFGKPYPPLWINVVAVSNNSVSLVWEQGSEGALLIYAVDYFHTSSDNVSRLFSHNKTEIVIRNLLSSTEYTFRIRSMFVTGGYWSDSITVIANTIAHQEEVNLWSRFVRYVKIAAGVV